MVWRILISQQERPPSQGIGQLILEGVKGFKELRVSHSNAQHSGFEKHMCFVDGMTNSKMKQHHNSHQWQHRGGVLFFLGSNSPASDDASSHDNQSIGDHSLLCCFFSSASWTCIYKRPISVYRDTPKEVKFILQAMEYRIICILVVDNTPTCAPSGFRLLSQSTHPYATPPQHPIYLFFDKTHIFIRPKQSF